jgi:hypothetical protein
MAECPPELDAFIMSDELLIENAHAYALRHQLQLTERLGFGIHGIIFSAENKSHLGKSVLKAHRDEEPFWRELSIYKRLMAENIGEILGFNIPDLLGADEGLRIIEMSLVARPFVLDFAGAYLDKRPEFSMETWAEWEAEKREQFGPHWRTVEMVLAALRKLDIYMVDISPSNIAFVD